MKGLVASIWAESLKVRRSKMLWITILVFSFIAVMIGLLVFISKHPDLVSNSQVISAKASAIGAADWPDYFLLLCEVIAMIGLIGFGFVFSWIFGREYSDNTVKDLLALPASRYTIVLSKFIIGIIWSALLSLILFVVGLAAGLAVNLPGWSDETALRALGIYAVTSIMTILLCTPVAFFASWGRGFLLPLGFLILIMIITQFVGIGIPGIAPYFPWAVPVFYCGAAGPENSHLEAMSYIILIFTSILGLFGTLAWWRFADQK